MKSTESHTPAQTPRISPGLMHVLRIGSLVAGTGSLMVIHYATPVTPMTMPLHDLHRHLLYVPIILAGLWYGWRGGITAAVAISAFFFPHLIFRFDPHAHHANHIHGAAPDVPIFLRLLEALAFMLIGGVTGYLTDRRRAHERGLADALERLRQRTREVLEIEEQLRRADRLGALGQLSAGLAHEIRSPLASIRGAAEILGDPKTDPTHREEFSRIMVEETERLDHVLRNFMDYTRAQRSENGQHCDLARVLERIRLLLGKQMQAQRVVLEDQVPAGLPSLAINENLMQQVLINLLLNALQALPGPGHVRVEAEPTGRERVRIAISDNGPGVPADRADRIFNPFFTTKDQGTGLGLSISHQILANHDGSIRLDEGAREGARFIIELPVAPSPAPHRR